MRELPILFSTEMVRAILDGRKTQTRRVVKYNKSGNMKPNPWMVGDRLYVRETWVKYYYVDENDITHYDQPTIYYAADGEPDFRIVDGDGFEIEDQRIKWKPSIHMPKEAARIWLEVTDVRVEKLQEMKLSDIYAEGIVSKPSPDKEALNPRKLFVDLWNDIVYKNDRTRFKTECGKYMWDADPWVWVIEFRRVGA